MTQTFHLLLDSLIKVNNVHGTPYIKYWNRVGGTTNTNVIELYGERRNGAGNTNVTNASNAGLTTKVGEARVYWFGVSDAPYKEIKRNGIYICMIFRHLQFLHFS